MTERITVDRRHAHRRTIPAVVLMTTLIVGMGLGGALVRAYDTRLHEALQTLQKAAALVEAASAGTSPELNTGSTNMSTKPSRALRTRWGTSLPQGLRRTPTAASEARSSWARWPLLRSVII